jgi:hypothetical protein
LANQVYDVDSRLELFDELRFDVWHSLPSASFDSVT